MEESILMSECWEHFPGHKNGANHYLIKRETELSQGSASLMKGLENPVYVPVYYYLFFPHSPV